MHAEELADEARGGPKAESGGGGGGGQAVGRELLCSPPARGAQAAEGTFPPRVHWLRRTSFATCLHVSGKEYHLSQKRSGKK
jgi:hypothetical protein